MGDGFQEIWVMIDGERFRVRVEDINQRPVIAYVEDSRFEIEIEEDSKGPEATDPHNAGTDSLHSILAGTSSQVTAPMPGDITQVHVKKGQAVKVGDPLCVLDAMKMKNTIHAPSNGVIREISVSEGQSVEYGSLLFKLG
jgi:biotin carboxyl carrier protein